MVDAATIYLLPFYKNFYNSPGISRFYLFSNLCILLNLSEISRIKILVSNLIENKQMKFKSSN